MIYLTANFTDKELACPGSGKCEMNPVFLEALQEVRDTVGRPFIITSGYRSPEHNKKVGGAKHSKHVLGCAVDISIQGWSGSDIHRLIHTITSLDSKYGGSGIGIYPSWIHFDIRFEDAAWVSL